MEFNHTPEPPIDEQLPPFLSTRVDLDEVLREAVKRDVSDIYFSGDEPVVARIHGKFQPLVARELNYAEVSALLIASFGDNAVAESKVQEGQRLDYSYECKRERYNDPRLRWRANAVSIDKGGYTDIRLVMRRIQNAPPRHQDLGIETELMEISNQLKEGMVIVSGPTGSGKSTLLGSILRDRVENPDDHSHLVTLERPIEYTYDAVDSLNSVISQIEIGRNLESFQVGVENALRQDPDIILVGESRDYETIAASLQAAMTGHALYTTTHDTGVANTVRRLVRAFPEAERKLAQQDLINVTHLLISQRLVPSTDGKRVALREYLVVDGEVKRRLRASPDIYSATLNALHEFGHPMVEDARAKHAAGLISDEILESFELASRMDKTDTTEAAA